MFNVGAVLWMMLGNWEHWLNRVQEYNYPSDYKPEYSSILVPNVDNVRTSFLMETIAKQNKVRALFKFSEDISALAAFFILKGKLKSNASFLAPVVIAKNAKRLKISIDLYVLTFALELRTGSESNSLLQHL